MPNATSPKQIAAALTELWPPRAAGEVDDAYIKVAKIHGALAWHSPDNEDELFLVLEGRPRVELEDRAIGLDQGEMLVVPERVRHNPVAEQGCLIMLIERQSTLRTGNVMTGKTCSLADQGRPP